MPWEAIEPTPEDQARMQAKRQATATPARQYFPSSGEALKTGAQGYGFEEGKGYYPLSDQEQKTLTTPKELPKGPSGLDEMKEGLETITRTGAYMAGGALGEALPAGIKTLAPVIAGTLHDLVVDGVKGGHIPDLGQAGKDFLVNGIVNYLTEGVASAGTGLKKSLTGENLLADAAKTVEKKALQVGEEAAEKAGEARLAKTTDFVPQVDKVSREVEEMSQKATTDATEQRGKLDAKFARDNFKEAKSKAIEQDLGQTKDQAAASRYRQGAVHDVEGQDVVGVHPETIAERASFVDAVHQPVRAIRDRLSKQYEAALGKVGDNKINPEPLKDVAARQYLYRSKTKSPYMRQTRELLDDVAGEVYPGGKMDDIDFYLDNDPGIGTAPINPEAENYAERVHAGVRSFLDRQGQSAAAPEAGGLPHAAPLRGQATPIDTSGVAVATPKTESKLRDLWEIKSKAEKILASSAPQQDKRAAHDVVNTIENMINPEFRPYLPKSVDAEWRMTSKLYDHGFWSKMYSGPDEAAKAFFAHPDPQARVLAIQQASREQKNTIRESLANYALTNDPAKVIKAEEAPVYKMLFGDKSRLADPKAWYYLKEKIPQLDKIRQASPEIEQRYQNDVMAFLKQHDEEQARTYVKKAYSLSQKLGPHGGMLRKIMDGEPDMIKKADLAKQFLEDQDLKGKAVGAMQGAMPTPESAFSQGIAEKLPGGKTEGAPTGVLRKQQQAPRDVPPATTPQEAAIHSIQMGYLGKDPGAYAAHRGLQFHGLIAAGQVAEGQKPSAWQISNIARGLWYKFTADNPFRKAFLASMENPQEAEKFFNSLQNPGTKPGWNTLTRSTGKAFLKSLEAEFGYKTTEPTEGEADLFRSLPSVPRPNTDRAGRLSSAKEVGKDVFAGESPDVTTHLQVGNLTHDDIRRILKAAV